MVIKRDFTFNKDQLISYYYNLKQFVGTNIRQKKIANLLRKQYNNDNFYNALDRKFSTLKFYGFVYFNNRGELMFNEYFKEYVDYLQQDIIEANCFLNILLSSNYEYFNNSKANFFELLISLLKDKSILYLDHIDIISYLQHYELTNDIDALKKIIRSNRNTNFADKVEALENFYVCHGLGNIAVPVHDARYLFTFLENNGFYTVRNSLQTKDYLQGESVRKLEDRRLYLSKDLLKYINGFTYESIVDEIEYNSANESEIYLDVNKDVAKLIDKSQETRLTIIKRYKADRILRNNALVRSGYICEIAKLKGMEHNTFPSRRYDGNYVEVHHLIPMHAQENNLFVLQDKLVSLDQISNLIVLCPNCHSKLHYGKSIDVRSELELLYEDRKDFLFKDLLGVEKEELLDFYNIRD